MQEMNLKDMVLVILLLAFAVVGGGCSSTALENADLEGNPPELAEVSKPLYGVSLSPRSYEGEDFTAFFDLAAEAGTIVTWGDDWSNLGSGEGDFPIPELADTFGYTPLAIVQVFRQDSGALTRPLDETTRKDYIHSAVAFAQRYQPTYFGIGVEINWLYDNSPGDFEAFAALFSDACDAIKAVSGDTTVFTIFQLETMKGLRGGLFGGTHNPAETQWSLLKRFPKADLIAFTTYPSLVFQDPDAIPDNYYLEIGEHTDKPIAITEMGWHTGAIGGGWDGSGVKQARFVERFFSLTADVDLEVVIWSFLYDQDTVEPFRTMGLWSSDGTPRPAWEKWLAGVTGGKK